MKTERNAVEPKAPMAGQKFIVNPNFVKRSSVFTNQTGSVTQMESDSQQDSKRPTSRYIAKIQTQVSRNQSATADSMMAKTARENPSQPMFPKGGAIPVDAESLNLVVPKNVNEAMVVSQSQAVLPTMNKIPQKRKQGVAPSQSSMSLRPSTAAGTSSHLLQSIGQPRKSRQPIISLASTSSPQKTTMLSERPQTSTTGNRNMSRAMKIEAKIAEENAKKRTVARAPVFASEARVKRRNQELSLQSLQSPVRKLYVGDKPRTPSLFTLERAKKRCSGIQVVGETHRLDDPYTPGHKYMKPEKVLFKGAADHPSGFSYDVKMVRTLDSAPFVPSIVTSRGGNVVTPDMFKPTLIRPKTSKNKEKDEESDNSDTPAQRAYKKQQAHVEQLYWHEGQPGRSADRDCFCVWGEARHYKREKKIRFMSVRRSKKSKEIWARLTRPKSAAVIRKRN